MKRLAPQSVKNSPQEYDKIFLKRGEGEPSEDDVVRWKLLLKYFRGGKLVDLGCLDSLVPIMAKQRFSHAEVWGVDIARLAIQKMQEKYPEVYYQVDDVYDTKFPSNYFDYAVAGELIEHLEYPQRFFTETARILKRGGILALSTPLEEENDPGAVDGERHLWSFKADDIHTFWKPHGTVKIKILRSTWFPIYKYRFPTLLAFCRKK